jgi:RNA polymerase sigma-B factor
MTYQALVDARQTGHGEAELLARWHEHGDERARDQLVRMHLPLARKLARRYVRSSEPFDDLLQVASLGLLKAIDRFDPERGAPLRSFAVPTILGEMRRYFRDCGWSVHVPRGAQERALRVRDAQIRLTNELGGEPDVVRLAEYLEIDVEQVLDALYALRSYESVSLDAVVCAEDDESVSFVDLLGGEDERFELVELGAVAAAAIRELPRREQLMVKLRYIDELTQAEIATRVGLSQMQVSRVLRRSLERLQAIAQEEA